MLLTAMMRDFLAPFCAELKQKCLIGEPRKYVGSQVYKWLYSERVLSRYLIFSQTFIFEGKPARLETARSRTKLWRSDVSQAQAAQQRPDPVNMKLSEPGLASSLSRKARKLRSKWFRLTVSDLLRITRESQPGLCKAVFCWILYNKRESREPLYIHSPLLINNLI